MNILLIDDETLTKAFVQRSIPEGSTLDYAQTLDEGLSLATKNTYDLIIADLRMPSTINGDTLLRSLEVAPQTPVLVLTALHYVGYASSLIRQGAQWVFFKPDSAMEPEIAERLLAEAIVFAIARHNAEEARMMNQTQNAAAIIELRKEVEQLQQMRQEVSVTEALRRVDQKDIEALQVSIDLVKQQLAGREAEREKGKWGIMVKIVAAVGAALAAAIPWFANRVGKP